MKKRLPKPKFHWHPQPALYYSLLALVLLSPGLPGGPLSRCSG